ncbi:class I SAM-dependent methyltransferase [Hymenobacter koreensis]|uniref:Bifunctional demethylmenaquinone methyltransferase/2-methoxy-6-polyprenyl-1,4-benzoquinol methylase UbiE n=1 Tax=Hymenobacter koreensis TaxID=1084523 RepID=A0ABP8J5N2_9BACT
MPLRSLAFDRHTRPTAPGEQVTDADFYQPRFVRALFDQLAGSYRWQQLISLGLTQVWRRQAVALLPGGPLGSIVDLMTGTGEMWTALRPRIGAGTQVHAVDFSGPMLGHAARRRNTDGYSDRVMLYPADATACPLPAAMADAVVCGFGLKTLAAAEYEALAREVQRLLRPGGSFVLVELTLPRQGCLRWAFGRYIGAVLPLAVWLSRGRAAMHRYLPYYAQQFSNLDAVEGAFHVAGLENVRQVPLLLGCATALVGCRTETTSAC